MQNVLPQECTVSDGRKFKIQILVTLVPIMFYHIRDSSIFCGIYHIYSLLLLNINSFCKLMVSCSTPFFYNLSFVYNCTCIFNSEMVIQICQITNHIAAILSPSIIRQSLKFNYHFLKISSAKIYLKFTRTDSFKIYRNFNFSNQHRSD